MSAELHGILVVDKPGGMTSADVVARVKKILGATRVGHTGTLDPMATGVLPIAVGEGTKLAPFLLAEDKAYEGELELGFTTTTLDVEGEVTGRADPSGVTAEGLRAAMAAWVGDHAQIPPMVSALKHGGRRLYELAREGKEVERAPRAIHLKHFELLSFSAPRGRFRVACSKGTYVRSLVRDVGEALGCGATLTALRRTQAGRFGLDMAIPLDAVRLGAIALVDPATALGHLPEVRLDAAGVRIVVCGKPMDAPSGWAEGQLARLLGPGGALVGVAEVKAEGPTETGTRRLRSLRVFNYGLTSP